MKKIDYGDDYEYASSRLKGTLVLLDKEPVIIQKIYFDSGVVHSVALETDKIITERPLSDYDVTPFKLGYVNLKNYCSWVSRMPCRYYKQGLTSSNISSNHGMIGIKSINFVNMCKNIYPSPKKCLELIKCGEVDSRAFSKDFSIGLFMNTPKLLFRGKKVGKVNHNFDLNLNYDLDNRFKYLDTMLEESLNV